jgi:hypothetical protein
VGTPTRLLLTILCLGLTACGASPQPVDSLEDCWGLGGPEEAIKSQDWRPAGERGVNPGYSRCKQWLRLELPADARAPELIVEIPYPLLDLVDLFIVRDGRIDHEAGGRLKRPADRLPSFRVRLEKKPIPCASARPE